MQYTPAVLARSGEQLDGRLARSVRARTAVVDALLDLIEEGDLRPTGPRIAERAGVSLRLVFHHFPDLETLFAAAAERQFERHYRALRPIPAAGPLAGRVAAFVHQRTRLLERITPGPPGSAAQEPFSPRCRTPGRGPPPAPRGGYAHLRRRASRNGPVGAARAGRRPGCRDSWATWQGSAPPAPAARTGREGLAHADGPARGSRLMDVVRTPDERFADLPGWPYPPRWLEVDGLRVHYVDAGPPDAAPVLLLHGEPSWSYLYRKMIPVLTAAGHRAVAPDLVGFGRSDKPAQRSDYTYQRHVDWMRAVLEQLDLRRITLVCQDWGGLIGLRLAAEDTERFARIVAANTGLPTGDVPAGPAFESWRQFSQTTPEFPVGGIVQMGCTTPLAAAVVAAYDAPFPDERYKAGARQFPLLVPATPDDPAAPANRRAWQTLSAWRKPFLTAFGDGDPVTRGIDRSSRRHRPGCRGPARTHHRRRGAFSSRRSRRGVAAGGGLLHRPHGHLTRWRQRKRWGMFESHTPESWRPTRRPEQQGMIACRPTGEQRRQELAATLEGRTDDEIIKGIEAQGIDTVLDQIFNACARRSCPRGGDPRAR